MGLNVCCVFSPAFRRVRAEKRAKISFFVDFCSNFNKKVKKREKNNVFREEFIVS
jgi:hypothetical protein